MHSNFGAQIMLPKTGHKHAWAFGEDQARYVITSSAGANILAEAKKANIAVAKIGFVTAKRDLQFGSNDTISLDVLISRYEGCIPTLMSS
jgi:phosphoribosylformylglycinamidine synthase